MGTTFPARNLATLMAGLMLFMSTTGTALATTPAGASHRASAEPGRRVSANRIPGGTQLWLDRFTAGKHRDAYDATLAVSPDGPVAYVTGYAQQPLVRHAVSNLTTVAYNTSTGAEIWMAAYQGTRPYPEAGSLSMVVSPNGNEVFIACGSWFLGRIVAYNAHTGALIWVAGTGELRAKPHDLAVSPDSSQLYEANGHRHEVALTAFAARSGRGGGTIASTSFRHQNALDGVAVTSDGSEVIVTDSIATIAYDATTGAQLWRVWDGGSMVVSPNSPAVYITKTKRDNSTGQYYYQTAAYNTVSGAVLWTARYPVPNGVPSYLLPAITIAPDGSAVFITGRYYLSECCDTNAVTIAYSAATGSQLWTAGYTGPGDSDAAGETVAVAPDGSAVYVLASTSSGNIVIGYDAATGAQLWDAATGSSSLSSIAVSADGHTVVVTGTTTATTGQTSYLTIGYRA